MSNIIGLPVAPNEIRALIGELKRDMDAQIELVGLVAKLKRATYDAYIAEGFTPGQALTLCNPAGECSCQ